MKLAISIAHPAQVHLFRNFAGLMKQRGHQVKVFHVKKEVSSQLLDYFKMDYVTLGTNPSSFYKNIITHFTIFFFAIIEIIRFNPDIIVGRVHPAIAIPSAILGKTFIALEDTENASLNHKLALPYIDKVITSECFKKNFSKKQIRINSYQELAYLHPNYFTPDSSVLDILDVAKGEKYSIIRFVSWHAGQDIGEAGLSAKMKYKVVQELSSYSKVFISSEVAIPSGLNKYKINIPPEKMHDALAFASLYFGESPTMTTESALLGTPAVCVSSWAYNCGNFECLRKRDMLYCFKPNDERSALDAGISLLKNGKSKKEWLDKRKKLLNETIDVNEFVIELIENYST